jgi:hypothetical protein
MSLLYTTSVTPPHKRDHTRLLSMKPDEYISIYGHKSLVADFISVDGYGRFQHMFKPIMTDNFEDDGSTADNGAKVVLFNASDELGRFGPMIADGSILGFDVAIVKSADFPHLFPHSKVLTKEMLKNTKFEDEKDMIAVCYPSHCPISYDEKVPYGDIENMGNHTIVNTLSATAARWLALATATYKNINDVNTITSRLMKKSKVEEFIGEGATTQYDFNEMMEASS